MKIDSHSSWVRRGCTNLDEIGARLSAVPRYNRDITRWAYVGWGFAVAVDSGS